MLIVSPSRSVPIAQTPNDQNIININKCNVDSFKSFNELGYWMLAKIIEYFIRAYMINKQAMLSFSSLLSTLAYYWLP